jgi:hypothetical protein
LRLARIVETRRAGGAGWRMERMRGRIWGAEVRANGWVGESRWCWLKGVECRRRRVLDKEKPFVVHTRKQIAGG